VEFSEGFAGMEVSQETSRRSNHEGGDKEHAKKEQGIWWGDQLSALKAGGVKGRLETPWGGPSEGDLLGQPVWY